MLKEDIKFVIDVETTGLDFKKEKIIEIAAVKLVNNEVVDTFETLVNPMQHIRSSSISIHNITEEMILASPTIEEVLPKFLDYINDKPIIGHNIFFDYCFVNEASLTLYGKELLNKRIDTLLMFKEVFPEEKSHGLCSLLKRFNVKIDTQHRALSDAYGLALVYEKLRSLYESRYSWQFSQLNNVPYLFERYLRIQNLIQSLQSEMGDIKSVFKLYFENDGTEIHNNTGDILSNSTKISYQYDLNKLKNVLEETDLIDKTYKINIGLVEKMLNNYSLDDEIKQKIIETRINFSESPNVYIQRSSKNYENDCN